MNQKNNDPLSRRVDPPSQKSGSTTTKNVNEQVMTNATPMCAKSGTVQVYSLTNIMIEDVFMFIDKYVVKYEIDFEELHEFFTSGTDSFVEFILAVELHFKWFDYTQAEHVIEILNIYLQKACEEYDQEY